MSEFNEALFHQQSGIKFRAIRLHENSAGGSQVATRDVPKVMSNNFL